jgi:microfibrillar-associated protein 1
MPAAAPRPPKPSKTRYFKGKGPEIRDSDSDSENEAPEPVVVKRDENYVAGGAGRLITNKDVQKGLKGGVKMSLADVQIGGPKKEEESEEESEEEEEEEIKPKARLIQPPGDEVGSILLETLQKLMIVERVRDRLGGRVGRGKEARLQTCLCEEVRLAIKTKGELADTRDKRGKTQATIAAEAEEAARLEEELQAQRKLDSKELAGETIRRELAESMSPFDSKLTTQRK